MDPRVNGGRGLNLNTGNQQVIVRQNGSGILSVSNQSNDRLGLNTIDDKVPELGPTPYVNQVGVKG